MSPYTLFVLVAGAVYLLGVLATAVFMPIKYVEEANPENPGGALLFCSITWPAMLVFIAWQYFVDWRRGK